MLISNAVRSDDLDSLFLKALSPRLLPYFTHLLNSENNRTENSPTVSGPSLLATNEHHQFD